MFWGLHVKASPKSSEPLEYEFSESVKLSQVALEPTMSCQIVKERTPKNKKDKGVRNQSLVDSPSASLTDSQKSSPVSLVVEHDQKKFILCTLDPTRNWQCPLDLVFQAGSSVKFSLRGHGTIHLTGYEIPDEAEDDDDDDQIDSSDAEGEKKYDQRFEVNVKGPDKKKAKINGTWEEASNSQGLFANVLKRNGFDGIWKDVPGNKEQLAETPKKGSSSSESSDDVDFEVGSDDDESDMDEDDVDTDDSDVSDSTDDTDDTGKLYKGR